MVRGAAAQLFARKHPPHTDHRAGRHRRIGDRPYMAVVDRIEGLDIDYPEDFTMAEIIAASRNLPK